MVLSLALAYIGGMATFSQVFLSLPMALDLLGESTPVPNITLIPQARHRSSSSPSSSRSTTSCIAH